MYICHIHPFLLKKKENRWKFISEFIYIWKITAKLHKRQLVNAMDREAWRSGVKHCLVSYPRSKKIHSTLNNKTGWYGKISLKLTWKLDYTNKQTLYDIRNYKVIKYYE